MRGIVRRAVSDREVKDEKAVVDWANKEAIPVLREMRDVHALEAVIGASVDSAGDAVLTNIWTSDPIATDSVLQVVAEVLAMSTSGATQTASYVRRATFRDVAGVPSQLGTTSSVYTEESVAGYDVAFSLSGSSILLDVQDDGVSPSYWTAKITVFRTPAA